MPLLNSVSMVAISRRSSSAPPQTTHSNMDVPTYVTGRARFQVFPVGLVRPPSGGVQRGTSVARVDTFARSSVVL